MGVRVVGGVCFDLDGTLLDTLEEIASAANVVLGRWGFPRHGVEDYRYFVGEGVGRLVERIVPEGERRADVLEGFVRDLGVEYARRVNRLTRVYPGVAEMLDGLVVRGLGLGVLSNKPHALTVDCVGRFFPGVGFGVVLGEEAGRARKPSPEGALRVASGLGCSPSEVWFVGDTDVDMETAKAAGMRGVGVLWGFREGRELLASGADCLVGSPGELLGLVDGVRG